MTDEQFKSLQTLIKTQTVEIKALALAVRSLEARIVAVEAHVSSAGLEGDTYSTEDLIPLLKTQQPRARCSDTE